MSTFEHFAYGSNLSTLRLRQRCPTAIPLAIGFVRCRQLRFHKVGRDGTGKADAFWTGDPADVLWGVVYRCSVGDRIELDRCESLGDGYEEAHVEVHVGDTVWSTFLYQAMSHRIDPRRPPAGWYCRHVISGAREHRLPREYQRRLAALVDAATPIGDAEPRRPGRSDQRRTDPS